MNIARIRAAYRPTTTSTFGASRVEYERLQEAPANRGAGITVVNAAAGGN